ncbi:acyl-CoA N-acyltransferase [Tothia fuscella]|uniref:Acyl-CoA N-acyltransferase n=1 Tax=Tothia fuscella TaxID=1048955 RepID=A0A9P4NYC9_9PEZI|nr:acyl-CoA N-acyltransferase [Tothia fuscella]
MATDTSNDATIENLPVLTKTAAMEEASHSDTKDAQEELPLPEELPPSKWAELQELHPYAQTLTLQDVDACVLLENSAFPEGQRASREKFIYRISACGELCLGLFTTADPSGPGPPDPNLDTATGPAAPLVETSAERKGVLLAHIVATKTHNHHVKDHDMEIPPDWQADPPGVSRLGHQEHGGTVAIHSLAVLPRYQGKGLGSTLLREYIKRIRQEGQVDRISLITYNRLITYYQQFGFENRGVSEARFGEQSWFDMVLTINKSDQNQAA